MVAWPALPSEETARSIIDRSTGVAVFILLGRMRREPQTKVRVGVGSTHSVHKGVDERGEEHKLVLHAGVAFDRLTMVSKAL